MRDERRGIMWWKDGIWKNRFSGNRRAGKRTVAYFAM
jgi:hypothetical protein